MRERTKKQERFFLNYFKEHNMTNSVIALNLVNVAHYGQRKDGKEERSHLFEVLGLAINIFDGRLNDKELDSIVTICALHDLVEDYSDLYSFKYLKGLGIPLDIVKSLKKVTKWKTFTKTEKDYKHYHRKIGNDFFATITKANDRIHNLSSCYVVFTDKRKREYIDETIKYIIPNLKKFRKEKKEHYVVITSLIQQLKMLCEFVEFTIKKDDINEK